MMITPNEMFIRIKLVKVFMKLESHNLSQVCRHIDLNYSHAHKKIRELHKMKLINIEKIGRHLKITYTVKGRNIRDAFEVICKEMGVSLEDE